MTIIVYRDGTMAADRASWCGGGIMVGHMDKIIRLKNGGLCAGCGSKGNLVYAMKYIDESWQHDDVCELKYKLEDGFAMLIVRPDGAVYRLDVTGVVYPASIAPFYAEGAAQQFIYGALHAGLSAEQAVRLAMRWTDYGGNDPDNIQVERLGAPL